MIKAVVFDLDDTLISEYEYIKSGYLAVAGYLAEKYKLHKDVIYNELMKIFHQGLLKFSGFKKLVDFGIIINVAVTKSFYCFRVSFF